MNKWNLTLFTIKKQTKRCQSRAEVSCTNVINCLKNVSTTENVIILIFFILKKPFFYHKMLVGMYFHLILVKLFDWTSTAFEFNSGRKSNMAASGRCANWTKTRIAEEHTFLFCTMTVSETWQKLFCGISWKVVFSVEENVFFFRICFLFVCIYRQVLSDDHILEDTWSTFAIKYEIFYIYLFQITAPMASKPLIF